MCLVLATDHLISDDAPFERAVGHAQEQVQEGNLVVFGIRPTAPETGYGYLGVAAAGDGPQALSSFVEKPDRKTAEQYLAEGRYYWNSGMFCFTAGVMADNGGPCGQVWTASEAAFAEAQENAGVTRFEEDSFIAQPDISIDYAVMENPTKLPWCRLVLPVRCRQLGCEAGAHEADQDGNSAVGVENVHLLKPVPI